MTHFLPAGKLLMFFMKSAVKPVFRRIVSFTKSRPGFINGCQWVGNKNHQMYVNIGKWSGNRIPLVEKHPKMSQEEAVEFCTDLLGEIIIISASVGFIVYEYRKSSKHKKKSNEADTKHSQRLNRIEECMLNIDRRLEDLEIELRQ